MKRRVIVIGEEARRKLSEGAHELAKAVSSTLGPYGLNFFLEKKQRPTNDGAKIASEIQFTDEIKNLGAGAIREAAIKTNDEAGDGTTTAITLAWAIYDACSKLLSKEGVMGKMRPADIVRQIEKERLEVEEKLKIMAIPVKTKEQLIASARVSVEDEELGKLIGEAQWSVGKEGFLLAEETAERTSSVERVHGLRIDNGFGTSVIVNNHEKQTLEVENTKVVLTSYTIKTLSDWQQIMKICESVGKSGSTQVVIIARAWTDETLKYCLENINRGAMKIYPLNAPYVDMVQKMKDLAAVLGATFFDSESTVLEDLQISDLGFAEKVVARRFDALITGKNDERATERIAKRVEELRQQIHGSQSEFEKKMLLERIAQLENGFAIVKVGSPSDMERKRLFDKAEDAVNAVRAAYQEGTVPGAGLAYKEIADSLPDTYILKRPLKSLYEQIMSSAPSDFQVEAWVRDPLKVVRIALEKACAAASAFATAGGAIAEEQPKPLDEMFRKQNTE